MLARRIIPCLDVDEGRVVKGVRFLNIRDAGDPVEAIAGQAFIPLTVGGGVRSAEDVRTLLRAGFVLNLVCIAVVSLAALFLAPAVLLR